MGKTYRGKDRDWARKAEKRRRQSEKWGGGMPSHAVPLRPRKFGGGYASGGSR